MKYLYISRNLLLVLIISVLAANQGFAQLIYQPYSYQFYQKLNNSFYAPTANLHTAIKPFLISDSSSVRPAYDSLMNANQPKRGEKWLRRVLFDTHLVDVKNKDYTFYLDFLPDFQLGREFSQKTTTSLNTRGYQIAGTIGANFFFYTSGYENQGKFANYEADYIKKTGLIPGQAPNNTQTAVDWSYVTALIGFKPTKSITVELGQDKTFIGDGYRSVLLSDYASSYPLLRFTADLGKHVQYMAMWAYMEDPNAPQFNSFSNNRRKWGVFHYIDWNINKRASLGFFNALITEEANDQGKGHGFDLNYVNPLFFASSLRPSGTTPDHTLFGFNGKYKVLDKTTVYGQFLYDQTPSSGNARTAFQSGFRGSDLFKVNKLNYLVEYNTAAPYTYSNQYPIVNYAQMSEPLAHPYGANFKELLGIMNYSIGKFDFQGELNHAHYRLNVNGLNYGKDISLSDHSNLPANGNGLSTSLNYVETTVAYLLNPKYNLRIEAGGILREEKNTQFTNKTALITFGLRSSFRNLYHDF